MFLDAYMVFTSYTSMKTQTTSMSLNFQSARPSRFYTICQSLRIAATLPSVFLFVHCRFGAFNKTTRYLGIQSRFGPHSFWSRD